jgi:SAM-dependent methyltransferase
MNRASGIDRYAFLHEPEGRRRRGLRIVAALENFGGIDTASARVLDIGCSAGLMTDAMAARGADVVGIDMDIDALRHAAARRGRPRYVAARGEWLPFADGSFDAVVCNHVYEHAGDPFVLMREAHRVLRAGGACYVGAGHTLQLIEPHHRLPLLSWLPRPLAGAWLRRLGRASDYDERFLAPWRLTSLFAPFADVAFISPRMLREPERYAMDAIAGWPSPLRVLVHVGAPIAARLAPTWIYMLRKEGGPRRSADDRPTPA